MRKREKGLWKSTVIKWTALFAVVFALSLPVTAQLCLASNSYRVNVSQGYLALRSGKSYNAANEIGELYSGELVEVLDASDPAYWYVYSAKTGQCGYVNKDYLVAEQNTSNAVWTVKVDKGYLALRTEKDYDTSNEIGELYTGDQLCRCFLLVCIFTEIEQVWVCKQRLSGIFFAILDSKSKQRLSGASFHKRILFLQ